MQYIQTAVALGSAIQLCIVTSLDKVAVDNLFAEMWRQIFLFERQCSRFLPGSELSVFNRNAGTKQFVSDSFRRVLVTAKELSVATDGLYNPFILPALQAAGYDHSFVKGYEHDAQDDHSRKKVVSCEHLEIGDDWGRIPYGTALDLGGCGKGYIADQLATFIEPQVDGYWLSLGGDIIAGGLDETQQPWRIAIQKAQGNGKQDIGHIRLLSRERLAAATSGTSVHRGVKNGRPWHHLIDPQSGEPVQSDMLSATVCHASGAWADVLASCAVIAGSEQAEPLLAKHHAAAYVLQAPAQQTAPVTFGTVVHIDGEQQVSYNK
ncbi:MAG TPA: FAD:protein FMN transferase [Candidatus Saccharimonadales bacterium]